MTAPLVISLSPRAGGNSDAAAEHYVKSCAQPCVLVHLRDYDVRPCTGCGACAATGSCVLAQHDQAEILFSMLQAASRVVLVAPVYFYHLPAQAKGWVDRSQSRYMARESGILLPQALRPASVVLLAGRPRGENLFAGILTTLRYFLPLFDLTIAQSVCLRGIDAKGDFRANEGAMAEVTALGCACT